MSKEDREDMAQMLREFADDIENPTVIKNCSIEIQNEVNKTYCDNIAVDYSLSNRRVIKIDISYVANYIRMGKIE